MRRKPISPHVFLAGIPLFRELDAATLDRLGERVVKLPATKAAVAAQLNLTPETFSRLLRDFADRGLVRVEGRTIIVPDAGRLATASGR